MTSVMVCNRLDLEAESGYRSLNGCAAQSDKREVADMGYLEKRTVVVDSGEGQDRLGNERENGRCASSLNRFGTTRLPSINRPLSA